MFKLNKSHLRELLYPGKLIDGARADKTQYFEVYTTAGDSLNQDETNNPPEFYLPAGRFYFSNNVLIYEDAAVQLAIPKKFHYLKTHCKTPIPGKQNQLGMSFCSSTGEILNLDSIEEYPDASKEDLIKYATKNAVPASSNKPYLEQHTQPLYGVEKFLYTTKVQLHDCKYAGMIFALQPPPRSPFTEPPASLYQMQGLTVSPKSIAYISSDMILFHVVDGKIKLEYDSLPSINPNAGLTHEQSISIDFNTALGGKDMSEAIKDTLLKHPVYLVVKGSKYAVSHTLEDFENKQEAHSEIVKDPAIVTQLLQQINLLATDKAADQQPVLQGLHAMQLTIGNTLAQDKLKTSPQYEMAVIVEGSPEISLSPHAKSSDVLVFSDAAIWKKSLSSNSPLEGTVFATEELQLSMVREMFGEFLKNHISYLIKLMSFETTPSKFGFIKFHKDLEPDAAADVDTNELHMRTNGFRDFTLASLRDKRYLVDNITQENAAKADSPPLEEVDPEVETTSDVAIAVQEGPVALEVVKPQQPLAPDIDPGLAIKNTGATSDAAPLEANPKVETTGNVAIAVPVVPVALEVVKPQQPLAPDIDPGLATKNTGATSNAEPLGANPKVETTGNIATAVPVVPVALEVVKPQQPLAQNIDTGLETKNTGAASDAAPTQHEAKASQSTDSGAVAAPRIGVTSRFAVSPGKAAILYNDTNDLSPMNSVQYATYIKPGETAQTELPIYRYYFDSETNKLLCKDASFITASIPDQYHFLKVITNISEGVKRYSLVFCNENGDVIPHSDPIIQYQPGPNTYATDSRHTALRGVLPEMVSNVLVNYDNGTANQETLKKLYENQGKTPTHKIILQGSEAAVMEYNSDKKVGVLNGESVYFSIHGDNSNSCFLHYNDEQIPVLCNPAPTQSTGKPSEVFLEVSKHGLAIHQVREDLEKTGADKFVVRSDEDLRTFVDEIYKLVNGKELAAITPMWAQLTVSPQNILQVILSGKDGADLPRYVELNIPDGDLLFFEKTFSIAYKPKHSHVSMLLTSDVEAISNSSTISSAPQLLNNGDLHEATLTHDWKKIAEHSRLLDNLLHETRGEGPATDSSQTTSGVSLLAQEPVLDTHTKPLDPVPTSTAPEKIADSKALVQPVGLPAIPPAPVAPEPISQDSGSAQTKTQVLPVLHDVQPATDGPNSGKQPVSAIKEPVKPESPVAQVVQEPQDSQSDLAQTKEGTAPAHPAALPAAEVPNPGKQPLPAVKEPVKLVSPVAEVVPEPILQESHADIAQTKEGTLPVQHGVQSAAEVSNSGQQQASAVKAAVKPESSAAPLPPAESTTPKGPSGTKEETPLTEHKVPISTQSQLPHTEPIVSSIVDDARTTAKPTSNVLSKTLPFHLGEKIHTDPESGKSLFVAYAHVAPASYQDSGIDLMMPVPRYISTSEDILLVHPQNGYVLHMAPNHRFVKVLRQEDGKYELTPCDEAGGSLLQHEFSDRVQRCENEGGCSIVEPKNKSYFDFLSQYVHYAVRLKNVFVDGKVPTQDVLEATYDISAYKPPFKVISTNDLLPYVYLDPNGMAGADGHPPFLKLSLGSQYILFEVNHDYTMCRLLQGIGHETDTALRFDFDSAHTAGMATARKAALEKHPLYIITDGTKILFSTSLHEAELVDDFEKSESLLKSALLHERVIYTQDEKFYALRVTTTGDFDSPMGIPLQGIGVKTNDGVIAVPTWSEKTNTLLGFNSDQLFGITHKDSSTLAHISHKQFPDLRHKVLQEFIANTTALGIQYDGVNFEAKSITLFGQDHAIQGSLDVIQKILEINPNKAGDSEQQFLQLIDSHMPTALEQQEYTVHRPLTWSSQDLLQHNDAVHTVKYGDAPYNLFSQLPIYVDDTALKNSEIPEHTNKYPVMLRVNDKTIPLPHTGYYFKDGSMLTFDFVNSYNTAIQRNMHYLKVLKNEEDGSYSLAFCDRNAQESPNTAPVAANRVLLDIHPQHWNLQHLYHSTNGKAAFMLRPSDATKDASSVGLFPIGNNYLTQLGFAHKPVAHLSAESVIASQTDTNVSLEYHTYADSKQDFYDLKLDLYAERENPAYRLALHNECNAHPLYLVVHNDKLAFTLDKDSDNLQLIGDKTLLPWLKTVVSFPKDGSKFSLMLTFSDEPEKYKSRIPFFITPVDNSVKLLNHTEDYKNKYLFFDLSDYSISFFDSVSRVPISLITSTPWLEKMLSASIPVLFKLDVSQGATAAETSYQFSSGNEDKIVTVDAGKTVEQHLQALELLPLPSEDLLADTYPKAEHIHADTTSSSVSDTNPEPETAITSERGNTEEGDKTYTAPHDTVTTERVEESVALRKTSQAAEAPITYSQQDTEEDSGNTSYRASEISFNALQSNVAITEPTETTRRESKVYAGAAINPETYPLLVRATYDDIQAFYMNLNTKYENKELSYYEAITLYNSIIQESCGGEFRVPGAYVDAAGQVTIGHFTYGDLASFDNMFNT